MKMPCTRAVLLALVLIGAVAGSAQALDYEFPNAIYWTFDSNVGTTRPVPHHGDAATPGWTLFSLSDTTFNWAKDSTIWFSMDNEFDPRYTKGGEFILTKNTFGFFSNLDSWLVGFGYDYDNRDFTSKGGVLKPDWVSYPTHGYPDQGQVDSKIIGAGGSTATFAFSVDRQPSWEWISVKNVSGGDITWAATNGFGVSGWSRCTYDDDDYGVPEPSLGLLLLAGIIPLGIGLRRRQRRLAEK